MGVFRFGLKKSATRGGLGARGDEVPAQTITMPITKVFLPEPSAKRRRGDFLPMLVLTTVFVCSIFLGNKVIDIFKPIPITSIEKTSQADILASPSVAKKVSESALGQSWRELQASLLIGKNKLFLFGVELWEVAANYTADQIDWLAYGASVKQQEFAQVIKVIRLTIDDSLFGAKTALSSRLNVATEQVKNNTLALTQSSVVDTSSFVSRKTISPEPALTDERPAEKTKTNTLNWVSDFDQKTTTGLIQILVSFSDQVAVVGQKALAIVDQAMLAGTYFPQTALAEARQIFSLPVTEETSQVKNNLGFLANNVFVGGQTVVATTNNFFAKIKIEPSSQLSAVKFMGIVNSTGEFFTMIGDRVVAVWNWLKNLFTSIWQTATTNWKGFFGLQSKADVQPVAQTTATIDGAQLAAFEERIKNDLRNDLRQEIANTIQKTSINNISNDSNEGLLVMPSTGNVADDEKLKTKIQGMFSDQVHVELDSNRKAGIVTPVFNPTDSYIFLLTPLKK